LLRSLALHLEDQARLLEQVRLDHPAGEEVARLAILVELQLHELAEARGVRVADGLRVPKGSRIGFVSMFLEPPTAAFTNNQPTSTPILLIKCTLPTTMV
jgi:hypothetical protein